LQVCRRPRLRDLGADGNDIAATQLAVDGQIEHRPKNNSSVLHEWSGTFIHGWREGADLWLDERRAFAAALDERKWSKSKEIPSS